MSNLKLYQETFVVRTKRDLTETQMEEIMDKLESTIESAKERAIERIEVAIRREGFVDDVEVSFEG